MRRRRQQVRRLSIWAGRIGVALCIGSGALNAQQTGRNEAVRQFAEAAAATARRDFARAEEQYRKVIEMDPRSSEALNNLGMVYYLEHKYPQAEEALARAVKFDPSLSNARVLLGASLWRQGKLDRAIAALDRALQAPLSDSTEKTARTALHGALFAQENYARALEVLKPLADKYPQDVDVEYSLGQTYLQLAAQNFRKIALTDPESYRIHQILGESLAKQGRHRDAILEYRLALARRPDLPGIHYQIGLLYWVNEPSREGEDAALREFEEELKINPYHPWSEYRLGQVYRKRKEASEADSHFRRAIALDNTLAPALLALASELEAQGNLEEAQKQIEAAERLEPDNSAVHFRLAQICKQRGDQASANEEMRKFDEVKGRRLEAQRDLEKVLRLVAEPKVDSLEEAEQ
jgi:tetratricopeptide (TPR) repeat protein